MQRIDETRLETDLDCRFEYLTEFIGFTHDDITAIQGAAAHLIPLVDTLAHAVYEKLFSYDATKRHFVPHQHGFDGPVPEDLQSLTLDHPHIAFRERHLRNYFTILMTATYDKNLIQYLDSLGRIHTSRSGSWSIKVPLLQMNALLGFLSDALFATIVGLGLDRETETRTLRAFNKLLWIQSDLISRHYQ